LELFTSLQVWSLPVAFLRNGPDRPEPHKENDQPGTDSGKEVSEGEAGSKQRTNLQEKFLASLFFVSVCQTKKSFLVFMSVLS